MNLTEQKWPMWFENAAENLQYSRKGLDIATLPKRKGPAIVVGGGPSVYQYDHLSLLAKYRDKIPTIISTDKMLKPLIGRGCTPDLVCTIDGDPMISDYYKLHSDERGAKVATVLNVVTTSPLTLKAAMENLTGGIYWYTHLFDDPTDERCEKCNRLSVTAASYFWCGKKTILQAAGNVGAFCWSLANFLECDPIILVGMDFGYLAGTPLEKTIYYDALLKQHTLNHLAKILPTKEWQALTQPKIEEHAHHCKICHYSLTSSYQERENPDFHNRYLIDVMFEAYRTMLMPGIKAAGITTINATGGGALHGTPIVGMDLETAIGRYCN